MIYELFEDLKAEIDGYDVQSIAYTSGVSDQTIYNWLVGKTKKPRIDTLTKVANAIGFELRLSRKQVKLTLVK